MRTGRCRGETQPQGRRGARRAAGRSRELRTRVRLRPAARVRQASEQRHAATQRRSERRRRPRDGGCAEESPLLQGDGG